MLELKNVEVVYSGVVQVLRSVNIDVPKGSVVAILGANGAGKSTTLKAISSLLEIEHGEVSDGEILYQGKDIANTDPADIVRQGIVQVLEGRKVLEHLTVEQNLRLGAHFRKDRDVVAEDVERVFNYFPALRALLKRTAGYLSGGEMQMLLVGRALLAKPKILLLDEPTMGLAPLIVEEIVSCLKQIHAQEDMSMIIVEQNANAALSVADYAYVLENGRIVMHGPKEELQKNQDIQEFYLGLSIGQDRKSFREIKHYKRRKRWLG
ncbi:MAG: ABC transporter ATP-binding protein [Rhodobacteraceae bacterium]|nr:ABC transporter ATP-binding protein [Paracoccaceae bacterium]